MASNSAKTDRWKTLDFGPPGASADEPGDPVLLDYRGDGAIAVITLNRPAAANAITTEMGVALTEILETIACPAGGPCSNPHRCRRSSVLSR